MAVRDPTSDRCVTGKYMGHNYIGHNYIGHNLCAGGAVLGHDRVELERAGPNSELVADIPCHAAYSAVLVGQYGTCVTMAGCLATYNNTNIIIYNNNIIMI